MIYDYSKLRGKMREAGYRQRDVGIAAGLTPTTYSLKLNNKGEFRQSEITAICDLLNISPDLIPAYFFTPKV